MGRTNQMVLEGQQYVLLLKVNAITQVISPWHAVTIKAGFSD